MFMFVVAAAFKKGELSVNKSTFNPFKILVTVLFVSYVILSVLFMTRTLTVFAKVESNCPGIMKTVSSYKPGMTVTYTCVVQE